MTSPLERAAVRLNALQVRMPDVVRLARVASLAVRIEPQLLRRLRLELLPEADVGSESDLWFSPLMESRGATAVVLQQHAATLLRDSLAGDRRLLARAATITSEAHAHLSPVLRLEESVTALALLEGDAAVPRIDAEFRPVLRALKEDDERAQEMARWMLRAGPRFPSVVWQSSNAYSLLHASSVLLGGRRILEDAPRTESGDLDTIAWALPASIREARVAVGVERLSEALQFTDPEGASATIDVPPTTPPVVEVRWARGGSSIHALVDAVPGRVVDIGPEVGSLTLRTLAGDVYAVERETVRAASFTHDVYISYARQDAERATQLAAALDRAKMSVFLDREQLRAGQSWAQELDRGVRGARVVVVLWSEAAAASEWVHREAALGLAGVDNGDRKSGALVPVLLDRVPLTPELSRLDAADLTGWSGSATDPRVQRLLQDIRRLLDDEPATAAPGWRPERARILEPTWMEQACVRIRNDRGEYASGFHVAPQVVATVAAPFAGTLADGAVVVIQHGEYEEDGRVLGPVGEVPVLLLQTGLTNDEPLRLVTEVTGRPSVNEMTVPSTARVIVAFRDGVRSIEAQAHVLRDNSESFEVSLPERDLPPEFLGAPVIIGDGAAGMVTGMQTGVFAQSTLRVTGAIVLESLMRGGGGDTNTESKAQTTPESQDSWEQATGEVPPVAAPPVAQPGLGRRIRDTLGGLFGGRRQPESVPPKAAKKSPSRRELK